MDDAKVSVLLFIKIHQSSDIGVVFVSCTNIGCITSSKSEKLDLGHIEFTVWVNQLDCNVSFFFLIKLLETNVVGGLVSAVGWNVDLLYLVSDLHVNCLIRIAPFWNMHLET